MARLFVYMNKPDISIKAALLLDAEKITALVNSVYRGENSKKGWTTEAGFLEGIRITPEKVKEIISGGSDIILTAVLSGDIIGCVQLERKPGYTMLGMLSVDVNHQDKGIGKLLINECECYTKEVYGLDEIRMKVIGRRTELIDYYKRRGYEMTGEREEFGKGGDTFGEPKEKLYFEQMVKKL